MKLIYVFLIFATGCTRIPDLEVLRWNGQGSRPAIEKQNLSPTWTTASRDLQIVFHDQQIQGAVIEGSFAKEVIRHGVSKQLAAAYVKKVPKMILSKVQFFQDRAPTVVPELMNSDPRFKKFSFEVPQVIIDPKRDCEVFWKITYFDEQGLARSIKVNSDYQIVESLLEGSQFHPVSAWVYPLGPKLSDIKEVLFTSLMGDGSLTAESFSVATESYNKAKAENQQLKFPPSDEKFDQVQIYFYIEKALHFFKEKLQVVLPFKLKAIAAMGFPEKTNTAFYYNGQIRLGTGDDISYSRIPQDPSIVIHETSHALIEAVAKLPYQGEGGSLNEGFADFFTAVLLRNPNLGEVAYKKAPFKRTVFNNKKLSDKKNALYADSAIVSGTLWEIFLKTNEESALKFAMDVLNRLNPSSDFADFSKAANEIIFHDKTESASTIKTTLESREWL